MKWKQQVLLTLIINIIILLCAMWSSVNLLFTLVFIIWLDIILYAYKQIENRSMIFFFMIAFFVFLMGRDLLEQFFGYKVENFSESVNNHAYITYIIALLGLWIGYFIFENRKQRLKERTIISSGKLNSIKKISKILYIITWFFGIASKLYIAKFIGENSYFEYYTDYSSHVSGNSLMYLVSKIELMMPVAFSIFMATMPTKKEFRYPLLMYMIYLVSSLGTGQRSTFLLGVLWIFVYIVYRSGQEPEQNWFKRKYLIYGVLALPIVAISSSVYSIWREGANIENLKLGQSLIDFVYDQGVTTNVIKRSYMNSDIIPDGYIYSLGFTRSGFIARILGITIYYGNSVANALYGGSFAHAIGYIVLGSSYLAGRGVGTSSVAELFYDFSYLGVFIGYLIYGWLIFKITNTKNRSPFILSMFYLMITQLLWAPRGPYSGFIGVLFYPTTILTYVIVYVLYVVFGNKNTTQED